MRILFVADQVVPPVTNGSATVYRSWIEALAGRHELIAVLFDSDGVDSAEARRFLGSVCREHLVLPGVPAARGWKTARAASRWLTGAVFAPRPIEEWRRGPYQHRIAELTARHPPDLTLVSKLNSVPLFGRKLLHATPGLRVLDLHDDVIAREAAERAALPDLLARHPQLRQHEAYRRLEWRQRLSRLDFDGARRQEARLVQAFDAVLASEGDRRYHESAGLPVRAFPISWPVSPPPAPANRAVATFDVGFIASDAVFNLQGILHFAKNVLPLVQARKPDFSVLVAGRICEPLRLIEHEVPGLRLQGSVGDLNSFYQSVRIVAVPLQAGTGVSLKTLEAMGFGCPIVSTTVGARGLDAAIDRDLVVADDPTAFAASLLALLEDPARQERLGRNARRTAAVNHSAAAALARLDEVLEACAAAAHKPVRRLGRRVAQDAPK